ncbi:carbohydrate ABC transporter substrate-binding protein, partial [Clostridium perfringens]
MNTRRMISLGLLILVMIISGCAGNVSTEKTKTLTLWYWNRSLDDELI